MNSSRHLDGMVRVELTGAEPERTLYELNQAGIRMYRVSWVDMLTVRFLCGRRDCKKIAVLCRKHGETVHFGPEYRTNFWKITFLKRPVLTVGACLVLILTFFLPTRVLFFRVEGNTHIPSRQILAAMEECGIRFGISRRAVRSEKMKNALLETMPELKWAGINTLGCTAVVSVRERELQQEQKHTMGITSMVAATDGYITSSTVVKGTALCRPGQVVKAGQTLISGYADYGTCILATGAEGEVFAQTKRKLDIVAPSRKQKRTEELARTKRFSLILGKKRINFWKDSRIWDATCGRMYEEYYITLPGGFRLPICLAVETLTHWKMVESEWPAQEMEVELKDHARRMVLEQTIAGTVFAEQQSFQQGNGTYCIRSRFQCSEMIGRVMTEEIGDTNGKTG